MADGTDCPTTNPVGGRLDDPSATQPQPNDRGEVKTFIPSLALGFGFILMAADVAADVAADASQRQIPQLCARGCGNSSLTEAIRSGSLAEQPEYKSRKRSANLRSLRTFSKIVPL